MYPDFLMSQGKKDQDKIVNCLPKKRVSSIFLEESEH